MNSAVSHFFAMLSRMKYITRWGLMRNSRTENLSEHTLEVAYLTQALCEIGRTRLGKQPDTGHAVLLALHHDTSEILTGDLPSPVKYYNRHLKDSYHDLERISAGRLLQLLPAYLRGSYERYMLPEEADAELLRLVKAADKLSALIKCVEEERMGNHDFSRARAALEESVRGLDLDEVQIFMDEFFPAYTHTIDELPML